MNTALEGHPGQLPAHEGGPWALPTVYFEFAQQVTCDTTECTSLWTAPKEEYSSFALFPEVLQSHLPHTTAQKWLLLQ